MSQYTMKLLWSVAPVILIVGGFGLLWLIWGTGWEIGNGERF